MVIAADVGGTKTVFASVSGTPGSLILSSVKRYENEQFSSFSQALSTYIEDVSFGPVSVLSIAAAGPVAGDECRLTNLNWEINARSLATEFSIEKVYLINDLFAAAFGVEDLCDDSFEEINPGAMNPEGNRVIVSPGTGLGESIIHGVDGHPVAIPGEGGHVDFAPIDGTTMRLWEFLKRSQARVSVEDILSGPGLFNIYSFLAYDAGVKVDESIILSAQPGSIITERGLSRKDILAYHALLLFLDVLAAEAGNMALKVLASGGVYIGGGIVPRLISILRRQRFREVFADKGQHQKLLESYPVNIIVDTELPLYGAGEYALSKYHS